MKSLRHQEAQKTRREAAADYGIRGADAKMYGTTDWYNVVMESGAVRQMRELDIAADPKAVGTLNGPYFTKSQARDERGRVTPADNRVDYVHYVWGKHGWEPMAEKTRVASTGARLHSEKCVQADLPECICGVGDEGGAL